MEPIRKIKDGHQNSKRAHWKLKIITIRCSLGSCFTQLQNKFINKKVKKSFTYNFTISYNSYHSLALSSFIVNAFSERVIGFLHNYSYILIFVYSIRGLADNETTRSEDVLEREGENECSGR